jgi:hypothetical protein
MAEHKYLLYAVGVISMATFQFGYNMVRSISPLRGAVMLIENRPN